MKKTISNELRDAILTVGKRIEKIVGMMDATFCKKDAVLPDIRERLLLEREANQLFLRDAMCLYERIEKKDRGLNLVTLEREAVLFRQRAQNAEMTAKDILSILEKIVSARWLWKGKRLLYVAREYKDAVLNLVAVLLRAANSLNMYTLIGGDGQLPGAGQRLEESFTASMPPAMPAMASRPCYQAQSARPSLSSFFSGKRRQPLVLSSVQFSAVAPESVVPGKYLPVNILMYEEAFRSAVDEIIQSYKEGAKESKSGFCDVQMGSEISVRLSSKDVPVEDEEETQIWSGKYLNFSFVVLVPEDYSRPQILLTSSVYINGIVATQLKLILDCEDSKKSVAVTREDVTSAFVSYASQDRSRVAAIIQGMKKARPDMDIFFDIESLRSGQDWEAALRSEIACRDVLFLCWSRSARDSQWVNMEWRYALQLKGEEAIEPIPIDPPDVCPPPVELLRKHFNDRMLYIIKATDLADTGVLCLRRVKTGEMVPLEQQTLRIGKDSSSADFLITDNATISRRHAVILRRGENLFIVDTGSANYTYVNGERIPSNVEVAVEKGTSIRLSDELFEIVRA